MQIFSAAQSAPRRFAIVVCHKMVRNIPGDSRIGSWELAASFQNFEVAKRMLYRAPFFTGCELAALVDVKGDNVRAMIQV